MLLRRGFKSQCERRSTELRRELGLDSAAPLSAATLADYMGVAVWSVYDVAGLKKSDTDQLSKMDGEGWSALTIRVDQRHLVIFNPAQSPPRINSVVMHELSHIMLGHPLVSAGLTEDGHLIPSNYDQDQEREADWLGGTLLLPRPALLRIRRNRNSDEDVTKKYQVSNKMLTWRIRMTGVDYQIANALRRKH